MARPPALAPASEKSDGRAGRRRCDRARDGGGLGEAVEALKVAICVRRGNRQADAGFAVLEAGAQAELLGLIAQTATMALALKQGSAVTWSEAYSLPEAVSQLDALLRATRQRRQPAGATEAETEAPQRQHPTAATTQTEASEPRLWSVLPRLQQPRTHSDWSWLRSRSLSDRFGQLNRLAKRADSVPHSLHSIQEDVEES